MSESRCAGSHRSAAWSETTAHFLYIPGHPRTIHVPDGDDYTSMLLMVLAAVLVARPS